MSVVSHIEQLHARHAQLEAELAQEMTRPLPDFFMIKGIKKQKLLMKEEIMRLEQDMPHRIGAS